VTAVGTLIAGILAGLFARRKSSAEADKTVGEAWADLETRLTAHIAAAEKRADELGVRLDEEIGKRRQLAQQLADERQEMQEKLSKLMALNLDLTIQTERLKIEAENKVQEIDKLRVELASVRAQLADERMKREDLETRLGNGG
jgi:hypothetical protein